MSLVLIPIPTDIVLRLPDTKPFEVWLMLNDIDPRIFNVSIHSLSAIGKEPDFHLILKSPMKLYNSYWNEEFTMTTGRKIIMSDEVLDIVKSH